MNLNQVFLSVGYLFTSNRLLISISTTSSGARELPRWLLMQLLFQSIIWVSPNVLILRLMFLLLRIITIWIVLMFRGDIAGFCRFLLNRIRNLLFFYWLRLGYNICTDWDMSQRGLLCKVSPTVRTLHFCEHWTPSHQVSMIYLPVHI